MGVVVKADKQGSLEAIEDALEKFNTDSESVKVISAATGGITESDIKLASSSKSIVVGFNVPVSPTVQRIADNEHVLVRTYGIIYELIDELKDVVEGMLTGELTEEVFGTAQIVAEFPFGRDVRIAGCKVLDGTISKGPKIRIVRGEEVIAEGKIKSIKKLKEEVARVEKGDECGIMFDSKLDFQIGDLIQSFRIL